MLKVNPISWVGVAQGDLWGGAGYYIASTDKGYELTDGHIPLGLYNSFEEASERANEMHEQKVISYVDAKTISDEIERLRAERSAMEERYIRILRKLGGKIEFSDEELEEPIPNDLSLHSGPCESGRGWKYYIKNDKEGE